MSGGNGGLLIISVGLAVVVIGFLVWTGALSWFGRLPGDIRIERGSFRLYFPLTSMVIVSIVLSLILKLLNRSR